MMSFNSSQSLHSHSNSNVVSQGTVPPPSALGVSGVLPGQSAVNKTKILSLTGFSKELKTRDIQNIFVDFEDDRGGYRIKWLDDTGCLIVFSDPLTAKRAFLHLLANPHPNLLPKKDAEGQSIVPVLVPYADEDAPAVVASVANRPRSRSIVNNGPGGVNGSPGGAGASGHGRRMSSSNSSMHGRGGSMAGSGAGPNGEPFSSSGQRDRRSFGRQSFGQSQLQGIVDESSRSNLPANPTFIDRAVSPHDTTGNATITASSSSSSVSTSANPAPAPSGGGAIDWSNLSQQQPSASSSMFASRTRTASAGNPAGAGTAFSPPVSPERGMRAGATSPSALRRLVQQRTQQS